MGNGDFASLEDARLYLPHDETKDTSRCDLADVPKEERVFKTKLEIAYETLLHQLELGARFHYIGAEGYYVNDADFATKIDHLELTYMLDILNLN